MKDHYVFKFIYLTNIFTMILLGIIIYWSIFPTKVIKFNSPQFKLITKTVKAGGFLEYYSDACKYENISGTVTRTFVNGVVFQTPSFMTNRAIGCSNDKVVVPIPIELQPGKYYMKTVFSYRVNPIRTFTIEQRTEQFEIIN